MKTMRDSYEERHIHSENKARYTRIPDRERGALKRLAKIMAPRYPQLKSYVQGDPRGASLYIMREGDNLLHARRGGLSNDNL